jgi:hypothetical protein
MRGRTASRVTETEYHNEIEYFPSKNFVPVKNFLPAALGFQQFSAPSRKKMQQITGAE